MNAVLLQRTGRIGWALALLILALTACDPGGRLAQLTPQVPAATPMLLGVTAESPAAGGGLATAATQPTGAPVEQPTLQPTPTYDPVRPAWTILYYASAENGRSAFVFNDLNEMEAAGATDQVRLVAQVDWPEGGPAGTADTVRYTVQPDADMTQLVSQPVAAIGEANLGDPAALSDYQTKGKNT